MSVYTRENGVTVVDNVPGGNRLEITPVDAVGKVSVIILGPKDGHHGVVRVGAAELLLGVMRARGLTKFEGTVGHAIYQTMEPEEQAILCCFLRKTGRLTEQDLSLLLKDLPPYLARNVRRECSS
jgi:hypothetical protein